MFIRRVHRFVQIIAFKITIAGEPDHPTTLVKHYRVCRIRISEWLLLTMRESKKPQSHRIEPQMNFYIDGNACRMLHRKYFSSFFHYQVHVSHSRAIVFVVAISRSKQ